MARRSRKGSSRTRKPALRRNRGKAQRATTPVAKKKPAKKNTTAKKMRKLAPAARRAAATIYDFNLDRTAANFQPLTPLTFLRRAARVFPETTAIIHGSRRYSYAEFYARSRRLASALLGSGLTRSNTVSVLLSNTPAMLEAHHGVPMAGCVLNALNTRLDPASIAFMLDHAETRVFIADREFAALATGALKLAHVKPQVVVYDDPEFPQGGEIAPAVDYEAFLAAGDPEFDWPLPRDEWDAISLNYTSGTTGNPKGVVCHHRGAALMAYSNTLACRIQERPVYLWTLPMFHCNGWCFPWTLALTAGTHVCLRWVRAADIYPAIATHRVTHLCGAPAVMSVLLNAPADVKRKFEHRVNFVHAAAPPPEAVLMGMLEAGFDLTHVYGLTETYGPATVNEWHPEWSLLPPADQGARRIWQGVPYPALEDLTVLDPETMQPVAADGQTLGEVMFRGNIVMKGYLKNPAATQEAMHGGWFRSGDLGVVHPNGYVQLKDRSKDIIISGGENISSIEVENTLYQHPAVMFAAVVAKPDEKWGETPCAFVEKKPGFDSVSEAELISFCRGQLAHFKCPRVLIFGELPKTTTGKIQKFRLREQARALMPAPPRPVQRSRTGGIKKLRAKRAGGITC